MLDAVALVSTDPVAILCAEQILKDEQFHASFGWEALEVLWPTLDAQERASAHTRLSRALAGFERTTCGEVRIEDLAGREVVIEASEDPNLGTLTTEQFAAIFYATLEAEIFPKLRALDIDVDRAWAERLGVRSGGAAAEARGAQTDP